MNTKTFLAALRRLLNEFVATPRWRVPALRLRRLLDGQRQRVKSTKRVRQLGVALRRVLGEMRRAALDLRAKLEISKIQKTLSAV